ncbi:MAG TPA: hypothetical protein VNV41_07500 [Candidatus Acidoferrales bacterium]|jgi:hypothetical protein|nr:hypothetical protein [Candidatus Acidoferrales bacterium]
MCDFLSISKGALTPLIACITVLIAYRQWQDNHLRLKRENYERSLKVYQEVVKMLQRINRDFRPEFNDLLVFIAATAEAPFLFHEEIPAYINEIFTHGNNLQTANFIYRAGTETPPPRDPDQYMKAIKDIGEEEHWFIHQMPIAEEKFKPYLRIVPKKWWQLW